MKTRIILLLTLLLPFWAIAQTPSKKFTVFYDEIIPKNIEIPDSLKNNADYQEITLQLEEMHETINYTLIVQDSVAEYIVDPSILYAPDNYVATVRKRNRWWMNSNEILYQTKFNEEDMLISEMVSDLHWEYHDETKEILGFQCKKATLIRNDYSNTKITAWYAEEISFSFGPKGLGGLPGLILEILQNEKLTIRAFEVDWELEGFLTKPSTGTKLNNDQWKKKVTQYFEVDSPFIQKDKN